MEEKGNLIVFSTVLKMLSKKLFGNAVLLFSFLFISCASTPRNNSVPAWLNDWRNVYSDTQYIAQRGYGNSEETAKTDAVAQIARYFKTSVNANLKTSLQSITDGENINETTSIVNDVNVMSQVELFAVETTDPFYFKKEKKWYCIAYIERDKAWEQYKPTVDNAKTEFYSMMKNAENESDSITKIFLYKKAEDRGNKLLEKLEYARILNSKKEEMYSGDRKTVSRIPSLSVCEKEKCTVFLDVRGDYGNIITACLSNTLSDYGLKIAKNQKDSLYIAGAIIENNTEGRDPFSVSPSLDLKIQNKKGKTVYAVQIKTEKKTLAYTLENAQKKSFPVLAEEMKNKISSELDQYR